MAYALDPEFHDHAFQDNPEVAAGMERFLNRFFPRAEGQVNVDKQVECMSAWVMYLRKGGIFGTRTLAWDHASKMRADLWWRTYWMSHPDYHWLSVVAVCVLSQTCSASACERNWSLYDFIWNKKRNRLSSAKTESLVYVHANSKAYRNHHKNEVDYFIWDSDEEVEVAHDVADISSDSEEELEDSFETL
jgi:hypothetical protein